MYHAITIKDGRITGRHQSTVDITAETFCQSKYYAGQDVQTVDATTEYAEGQPLAAYDPAGMLRPIIGRIKEGLAEVPPGYELIGDELVETTVPEQEAPPTLMARVEAAESKAAQAGLSEKATRVMFRVLAANDTIIPADALDNQEMFEGWVDYIDKAVPVGIYLRHEGGLYRVQQAHTVQEHQPPSVHTAALYTRVQPEGAGPEAWQPGQSYAMGVEVAHSGGVWQSGVDNNVWEPGAVGVYDDIWRRVRDV